ncbi:parvalbumin-like EF-hand-containing protein, partial [Plectropomus leopardus]|uniref:parvalbumin-like EF-hand-containing protein n=1 Tax=Plectropomus leopardus TaxID=160734 RepID=UPI001C4C1223
MEDDFRPQVKMVAAAMGASLTERDVEHMPPEMRAHGNFNYDRFLEYMRQFKTSEQREDAIRTAFTVLDKDGSGYIEWNEIKYILSTVPAAAPSAPLSDEEAEAVIQAVDADGDGRINYAEFSEMVKTETKLEKKTSCVSSECDDGDERGRRPSSSSET